MDHDDLVLALALALWGTEKRYSGSDFLQFMKLDTVRGADAERGDSPRELQPKSELQERWQSQERHRDVNILAGHNNRGRDA